MPGAKTISFPKFSFLSAAALLLSLVYSPLLYDQYQLSKALILFSVLAFLLVVASFRPPQVPVTATLVLLLAYFVYISARLFVNPFPADLHYYALYIAPALFFIPVLSGFSSRDTAKFSLVSLFAVCCTAAYAFAQSGAGIARPYSFFGNPIFSAEFTVFLLPFCFLAFYYYPAIRQLAPAFAVLAASSLLLSGSRGAIFSAVLSLLFLIFLLRDGMKNYSLSKTLKSYMPGIVAACVLLLLIMVVPGARQSMQSNAPRMASAFSPHSGAVMNRSLMARVSLNMIKDAPAAGIGAGAVRMFYQKYQAPFLDAEPGGYEFINTSYIHNSFLHLAAEAGLTGLMLFAVFVLSVFRFFDKAAPAMENRAYFFCSACAASLTAFLAESFINFPLFVFPSSAVFFLACGMLYCICAQSLNDIRIASSKASRQLSVALLVIVIAVFNPGKISSNFYLQKGLTELEKKTNFQDMYFLQASKLDPKSFYPYFYLGYSNFSNSMFDEAASYYIKASEIYPASADILYNIASCRLAKDKLAEAENYYRKALGLYPGFVPALMNLGRLCLKTGREQEGLSLISKANILDPAFASAGSSGQVVDFFETTYELRSR